MWMGWLQIKHPGNLAGVGGVDFSNRLLSIGGYIALGHGWHNNRLRIQQLGGWFAVIQHPE